MILFLTSEPCGDNIATNFSLLARSILLPVHHVRWQTGTNRCTRVNWDHPTHVMTRALSYTENTCHVKNIKRNYKSIDIYHLKAFIHYSWKQCDICLNLGRSLYGLEYSVQVFLRIRKWFTFFFCKKAWTRSKSTQVNNAKLYFAVITVLCSAQCLSNVHIW